MIGRSEARSRALDLLEAWRRANSVDPAIEAITRKVAGRFVAKLFDDGGRSARTRASSEIARSSATSLHRRHEYALTRIHFAYVVAPAKARPERTIRNACRA